MLKSHRCSIGVEFMTNWVDIKNKARNRGISGNSCTVNVVRVVFKKKRDNTQLCIYVGRHVLKESKLNITNKRIRVQVDPDNTRRILLIESTPSTQLTDFKFVDTSRNKQKETNSYTASIGWEHFEPTDEEMISHIVQHQIIDGGIILHL